MVSENQVPSVIITNLVQDPNFERLSSVPAGATRTNEWAGSGNWSIYVPQVEDDSNRILVDFTGLTVPPTITDTGEAIGYFGAPPTVDGGFLDSSNDSALYMEVDVESNIKTIGARFMFDTLDGEAGSGGTGTMTLITWADGGIVANGFGRRTSCHVTITASNVQWWVRTAENGGTVTSLAGRTISGGLAPNVLHSVEVSIGIGVGVVKINGTNYQWNDSRIAKYSGENFACWEPYYGGSNKTRVKISDVWTEGDI